MIPDYACPKFSQVDCVGPLPVLKEPREGRMASSPFILENGVSCAHSHMRARGVADGGHVAHSYGDIFSRSI